MECSRRPFHYLQLLHKMVQSTSDDLLVLHEALAV